MKKKVFYRYNPHTLTYERVFPSLADRFLIILRQLLIGIFIGFSIFGCATYFFDSPREKELINDNKLITTQYKILSKRMDETIEVLTDIQQRDDYMYRAMFHTDPIPLAIRHSGAGGIGRYDQLSKMSNPNLIIQTGKKMDLIAKQLFVQSNSFDELVNIAQQQKDRLDHIPSIIPVAFVSMKRVASGYGNRMHPVYGVMSFHAGMDFTANTGTPVYATGKGVVEYSDWQQGYGNCVIIDHGYDFKTIYAHLNRSNVKVGQTVTRGEKIAEVGNTGVSTGPHLHYEVRVKGKVDNPAKYYFQDLDTDIYDQMLQVAANHGRAMD